MPLFNRAIRPPEEPNPNDPATVPPATVGANVATPGDPHGVTVDTAPAAASSPPASIVPSAWSGWPADWPTPAWSNQVDALTDIAWKCLDLNSKNLATMPPYLVGAAPGLDADWLTNPNPETYTSWQEFAAALFWDFQGVGEAFVVADAYYATGYPARFHVVPPWAVEVDMDAGFRRYRVGRVDVTDRMLHVRYRSSVDDAHGHGPLEAGRQRQVAAQVLARYATTLVAGGGIPTSVLVTDEDLSPEQAQTLKTDWMNARLSSIGEPAVLSEGVTWQATQLNPRDMALVELQQGNEARIAVLLGVPPFLVGLPSGGDPMTYQNVSSVFDFHWRAGLRPLASMVMAALSGWALPRGTTVEVDRDAYVQPDPYTRAQTYEIMHRIQDPGGGTPAMTVEEIRRKERLDEVAP